MKKFQWVFSEKSQTKLQISALITFFLKKEDNAAIKMAPKGTVLCKIIHTNISKWL